MSQRQNWLKNILSFYLKHWTILNNLLAFTICTEYNKIDKIKGIKHKTKKKIKKTALNSRPIYSFFSLTRENFTCDETIKNLWLPENLPLLYRPILLGKTSTRREGATRICYWIDLSPTIKLIYSFGSAVDCRSTFVWLCWVFRWVLAGVGTPIL